LISNTTENIKAFLAAFLSTKTKSALNSDHYGTGRTKLSSQINTYYFKYLFIETRIHEPEGLTLINIPTRNIPLFPNQLPQTILRNSEVQTADSSVFHTPFIPKKTIFQFDYD